MSTLIDRSYCLRHPQTIIRVFGLSAYLGILFNRNKGLLEYLIEHYAAHDYPMPGRVGDAYRLSSLLEYRMARIYGRLAEKFRNHPEACHLFEELHQEETEHGRLMELCRYTVKYRPSFEFVPSVRDPDIHRLLRELRDIERNADALSLDQALALTERLERSEINTIFDRLLKQADQSQSRLFEDQMQQLEGHSTSVPRRIQSLRQGAAAQAL